MVTPAAKREAVAHLQALLDVSERRACRVIAADRTVIRYQSCRGDDEDLREKLRALAQQRRRFGYRRLHMLLRRDGIAINRKKTQRLYRVAREERGKSQEYVGFGGFEVIVFARFRAGSRRELIDWSRFDEAYGRYYHEKGRPGLSTRLMAGLHLLKHMEGLSDEAVCARWVENPYFQYFCGEQYFRHKLPLDRSSMTRWRGRIGADKLELLLAETLRIAMETRAMPPQACERVTVDTTVQTKAVAHPTDSHLLMRGIEWLNRLAKKHGLKLRQSFLRVGRQARRDVSRLIHGRGHSQAMRWVRKLRTWLGRLDRDISRKIAGNEKLEAAFAVARERVAKILTQKADSTDKLYALHAPEVECIAKGKARTRYEFGVKTSIAVTNARTAGGQLIVGMQALPGNPYDGHINLVF